MPLSVTAAVPSLAPDSSFLFNRRRTWMMGVLNATPDSFYAGSRLGQTDAAVQLAGEMVVDKVDVFDLGGESTRPGAEEVPVNVELDRVLPMIDAVRARW